MSVDEDTPRFAVCDAGEGYWAVVDHEPPPDGLLGPISIRSDLASREDAERLVERMPLIEGLRDLADFFEERLDAPAAVAAAGLHFTDRSAFLEAAAAAGVNPGDPYPGHAVVRWTRMVA